MIGACVGVASAISLLASQDDPAMNPLFNGRDLSGWVDVNCAPETWTVRDGMIHSSGKPICELRTTRMYENFVFELEYKHLEAGGNAGVFIWGDALTARGQPFVRAIEVQVLDGRNTDTYTSHGDVFAIHGAKMTPDRPHPNGWARSLPSERRARPAGEWNHYRITAQNGTLKLAVNGKEVSGGYDISPRKGYIHLESEGGAVQWRNLRLKELPPGGALAPEHVAHEDEGFVSRYSGVDFRGWRHTPEHASHWVSKDWIIASDGKGTGSAAALATDESFGDVIVIADWRWTGGPDAETMPVDVIGADLPAEARASVARALAARATAKEGQWHRAIATKRGGRFNLSIDGDTVLTDVAVPGAPPRAPIVLRNEGRTAEYANVFVKVPEP